MQLSLCLFLFSQLYKAPSNYNSAHDKIWLDDVRCYGYESDIANCQSGGWGVNNCGHEEDVWIGCGNCLFKITKKYSQTCIRSNGQDFNIQVIERHLVIKSLIIKLHVICDESLRLILQTLWLTGTFLIECVINDTNDLLIN